MAKGLSRSLRGSLRSGVSSILFVLLYGQPPCLAYDARSVRRLVAQPVEGLSTARVVPGSMNRRADKQLRSTPRTRRFFCASVRISLKAAIEASGGELRAKESLPLLSSSTSACRTCVRARTNQTRAGRTRWNKNSHRRLPTSANAAALDASRQQHKTSLSVLFSGRPRDAAFISPDAQRTPRTPRRNRTHQ